MKVFIKELHGTKFEIEVNPLDTVADVKKIIETVEGEYVYPIARQILIHHGNILKEDGTTLWENNVSENDGILVIGSTIVSSRYSAEASTSATTEEEVTPEQDKFDYIPNIFDSLRGSRHFLPLRALMASNTRTFVPLLEEWKKHNSDLVKLIIDNAFDVFRVLYEPPEGCENSLNLELKYNEDEGHPRDWTDEDLLAIGRLEALGFSWNLVSEVFYTCNKDEETATEFLLSHVRFGD